MEQIAVKPFRFFTRMHLTELTGLRATTLGQLAALLRRVPGASIYHHTHRFLQQHLYVNPEPPNDFAYWVSEALGEDDLGERLASVDIVRFDTIRALRESFVEAIETHLKAHFLARFSAAKAGEEFHFMKSVSFVFPTRFEASTPQEFVEALGRLTLDSIYFHMFESRLRLGKETNDFSHWFETSLGNRDAARALSRLDPYTFTLDSLRAKIIETIIKEYPDVKA